MINKNKKPITFKGNIAVDACREALAAAKRNSKKIKFINLDSRWWLLFSLWMADNAPETDLTPDGVEFKNCVIRRGSRMMREKMEIEYQTGLIAV